MSMPFTPPMTRGTTRSTKFVALGRGGGGVSELAASLDDAAVSWALLRVSVGSGALAREKYVLLNFVGHACPIVRRGKHRALRPAAEDLLGVFNVEWETERGDETTLDALLTRILPYLDADSGDAGDVASLRAAMLAQIAEAKAALKKRAPKAKPKPPPPPPLARRSSDGSIGSDGSFRSGRSLTRAMTATALRADLTVEEAIGMCRAEGGALNWVLVTPEVELIEAGGGSVPEMHRFIRADEVQFALVRMGFGSGRFRRNHLLFVHWAGAACPHLVRGKANAQLHKVKRALLGGGDGIELSGHAREEIGLDVCITKMLKYLTVDGHVEVPSPQAYSSEREQAEELFQEALLEDTKALVAEFGIEEPEELHLQLGPLGLGEAEEQGEEDLAVAEVVRSVRDDSEPFNWVSIGAV
jgi:hypothetical protein